MSSMENELWRDRNKIFVAGIPLHVNDEALRIKFMQFGEMFGANVILDKQTRKSRGFGFVTFKSYESCLDAVNSLNLKKWDKRVLNVRLLETKSKEVEAKPTFVHRVKPEGCVCVFVGNMAYEITDKVLKKVFEVCGEIRSIRLCKDIKTNEFRGFGYVQFEDTEACDKAVQLHGTNVMGRPLRVDYDDSKLENTNDSMHGESYEEFQKKMKKGVCHKFENGECDRGASCKFAHLVKENAVQENVAPKIPDEVVERKIINMAEPDAPICQNFEKGKCKRGDGCRFRHMSPGAPEVNAEETIHVPQKVVAPVNEIAICRNYSNGNCFRGNSCRFLHVDASGESKIVQPVSTASSEYQTRFRNICYNWQNTQSCARGDACTFMHDSPTNVVQNATLHQPNSSSSSHVVPEDSNDAKSAAHFQQENSASKELLEQPDSEPAVESKKRKLEDIKVKKAKKDKKAKIEKKAKKSKKE